MTAKTILVLCAQALLTQNALSQCINRGAIPTGPIGPNRWAYDGLPFDTFGRGPIDFTPTTGGFLPVSSASPISPTGLTVFSENIYEGTLSVLGELPFLGTVTLEGALPTAGSGVINYGCGNGVTAMASEGFGPAVGPGFAPIAQPRLGYGCGDILY